MHGLRRPVGNPTKWSTPESVAYVDGGSDPSPLGMSLSVSGTTITAEWSAVSDGRVGGVIMQQHGKDAVIGGGLGLIGLNRTGWPQLNADGSTYTSTESNLLPGTIYDFVMCTTLHDGGEVYTKQSVMTAGTATGPVPNAPAFARASSIFNLTGGMAKLYWANSSNNETKFWVSRSDNGGPMEIIATTGPDDTTFTDTGLTGDGPWTYQIQAVNDAGPSGGTTVSVKPPPCEVVLLIGDNLPGMGAVVNLFHESVGLEHTTSAGQVVLDGDWSFGGDGTLKYYPQSNKWLGWNIPDGALTSVEGKITSSPDALAYTNLVMSKEVGYGKAIAWDHWMNDTRVNQKDKYDPVFLTVVCTLI